MNMKVKVLWGVKAGMPDWREEFLTDDESKVEDVKNRALANGYDRFRLSEIDLSEPPDFTKTINI